MDTIKLKRKVEIQRFRAIIDLGRQREKEVYLAILKLAQENEWRITPELIIERFFEGRPIDFAIRIIQNCKIDGLFDDIGNISEEGKIALRENKVFLKESGAYEFWTTLDPLIPQKILDIKPVDVRQMSKKANRGSLQLIPDWIKKLENQKINLLNKNREIIKIYEFLPQIEKLNNNLNLNIHFEIPPFGITEESKIMVVGDLKKNLSQIPKYTFEEIWLSLLGSKKNRWDSDKSTLLCTFDDVEQEESRLKFLIDQKFSTPQILDLGKFEDLIVRNIPIRPPNELEANKWANWILEHEIKNYIDEDSYEELCINISSKHQFSDFQITFPSQRDLAEKFISRNVEGEVKFSEKFWYLQTPIDLKINN